MKNKGLSLRYKILLFLTVIPVAALATYLYLAIGTFERDKIAYVFETSTSGAKALANQVNSEVNSLLISTRPALQDYYSNTAFGNVTQAVVDSDSRLQWISVYRIEKGKPPERSSVFSREGIAAEKDLDKMGDLSSLFMEAQAKGRLIQVPFKDERVLIVEKFESTELESKFFLIFAKLEDLRSGFLSQLGSTIYLVNDRGTIMFGPQDEQGRTNLSQYIPIDFLNRNKTFTTGTEEVLSLEEESFLVSFAKTTTGDLIVVSLVDKRAALSAVEVLLRQSIIFFSLLVSATTMIGLFASGQLTTALSQLSDAAKKVAEGVFDIRVKVKTKDEVGTLANSFNVMAAEISRLLAETAEKARMEGELKTAQTVQETLFPEKSAQFEQLEIQGFYEPASECGGDWWHYCQVGRKVFLWIGDATGHGAPAALITSAAKSAATIIERLNVEPAHALQLLNRAIYDVSKGRIMMTFFVASIDLDTHVLTYANASHEGPYLINKKDQPLKKKDLIPLNDVNDPRLGQARDTVYKQTKVDLQPGDRVLFYTDGIPDIQDSKKQPWGEREFIKAILSHNSSGKNLQETVSEFVNQFQGYRQKSSLVDDITFFMVQWGDR